MTPAVSHKIGKMLSRRIVAPDDRLRIVAGASAAQTWDDVPVSIRNLVERIAAEPEFTPNDDIVSSGYNQPQVDDDAVSHREFELLPDE